MNTYLFTYRYDGAEWELLIDADNVGEAKDKVQQIALARYEGELFSTIPARFGIVARLFVPIANFFRNLK